MTAFVQFLRRNTNKAFTEMMVKMVSREAGHRLALPCLIHPYGPKVYIDKSW